MEHIKGIANRLTTDSIPNFSEPKEVDEMELLRTNLRVSSLDNTFENFKPVAGTGNALIAFESLVEGKEGWKMLLCYGGVGNGKTHLLEAFVIEMYKRGKFCRILTMAEIMSNLKDSMNDEGRSIHDLLRRYAAAPRLVIDDVGMGGSGSAWEWGQLEDIIVNRYRENKLTVMTTNLDITNLPERIVSRFRDPEKGRVVLNEGADYRVPNKQ